MSNRFEYNRTRWPIDPGAAWDRAQTWLDFIEAMESVYRDAPQDERDTVFLALTHDYDAATMVMARLGAN